MHHAPICVYTGSFPRSCSQKGWSDWLGEKFSPTSPRGELAGTWIGNARFPVRGFIFAVLGDLDYVGRLAPPSARKRAGGPSTGEGGKEAFNKWSECLPWVLRARAQARLGSGFREGFVSVMRRCSVEAAMQRIVDMHAQTYVYMYVYVCVYICIYTVGALDKECHPEGPDPGGFLIR